MTQSSEHERRIDERIRNHKRLRDWWMRWQEHYPALTAFDRETPRAFGFLYRNGANGYLHIGAGRMQ